MFDLISPGTQVSLCLSVFVCMTNTGVVIMVSLDVGLDLNWDTGLSVSVFVFLFVCVTDSGVCITVSRW